MTPEEFMARAIEIGREGLHEKHARPFAALIVKQGQIVGEGRSLQRALNDPTAHGEIVAIRDACKRLGTTDLSGCEIYTTCEPCLLCVSAIWWATPHSAADFSTTEPRTQPSGHKHEFCCMNKPLTLKMTIT